MEKCLSGKFKTVKLMLCKIYDSWIYNLTKYFLNVFTNYDFLKRVLHFKIFKTINQIHILMYWDERVLSVFSINNMEMETDYELWKSFN